MRHGWHCTHRLVGGVASAAEAVCWTPDGTVVLSAGLQGNITMWNLDLLRPHQVVDSYGGAVWAMGYNSHGELGDGTTSHRHSPVHVSALGSDTEIASSAHHSVRRCQTCCQRAMV